MTKDKLSILLISQVFYPDQVAVSNLFTKLFERIAATGQYDITVWCAQPSYTTRERQPKHRNYKGLNIFYLPSTNFRKDSLFGRLLNVATFSVSVIIKLIFSRFKGTVVVHTTPPFLAILVVRVAKLKKLRVIYVLMDIFPDGLIRLDKASPRNPLIRLWKRWHRKTLKQSDRVVAIGRDMEEWVRGEVPYLEENQLKNIPLWQDEKALAPIEFATNPFVVKYNLASYFVVQFSGNMGLWNDLVTVGKAVSKGIEGVKFVFIGDGIRKRELVQAMGEEGAKSSLFLNFLSNDEYTYSVTACHCGLVTLRPEALGMGVPSKIFGIMAAGIPVLAIAPKNSEIGLIVLESNSGMVVEPGNAEGLIKAIITLKDNDQLRLEMGRNGRTAFEKKYTLSVVASRYYELLSY
jgi:glycosyltransferase involved in cell wall biosynthesis